MIVLERTELPPCSAFPGLTHAQCEQINRAWHGFQVDLSRLSKYGELRPITGSGHLMQQQKHEARFLRLCSGNTISEVKSNLAGTMPISIRDPLGRIHREASNNVEMASRQMGMIKKFDVIAIGTGSAASAVASRCREAGWQVAIMDSRPFGGTCPYEDATRKRCLSEPPKRSTGLAGWREKEFGPRSFRLIGPS